MVCEVEVIIRMENSLESEKLRLKCSWMGCLVETDEDCNLFVSLSSSSLPDYYMLTKGQ